MHFREPNTDADAFVNMVTITTSTTKDETKLPFISEYDLHIFLYGPAFVKIPKAGYFDQLAGLPTNGLIKGLAHGFFPFSLHCSANIFHIRNKN